MTALFWPIGVGMGNSVQSACSCCGSALIVILDGGRRQAFEYGADPPGEDGRELSWDHFGRPDGWISLLPHACPSNLERMTNE